MIFDFCYFFYTRNPDALMKKKRKHNSLDVEISPWYKEISKSYKKALKKKKSPLNTFP